MPTASTRAASTADSFQGDRAQRIQDVRPQPQVGVPLSGAPGQGILHHFDRPLDVAASRPQQAEPPYNHGANYERLVDVKRTYDPDNLFRLNQNLEP